MSVPRYRNLRKERHQQQLKDLNIGKQVNSTISRKMHNFDNGIDEDLEEKDDRSNYERNEDLNYIRQQIGVKLNTLFANDHDEVNTFMEFINENQVSIQDFNAIYPELLKNSDPNTTTSAYMIPKFKQLHENEYATGSTNQSSLMKDIYNLVKEIYENGKLNMSEKMADDLIDRAEFYTQSSPSSEINEKAKDIISSDESKEDIVVDLVNLFETPLKQKKIDDYDDWTPVESKSSRKKKKKERKQQEDDEKFSPTKSEKYTLFSSKKLNKKKKDELQELAQQYGLPSDGYKKDLVSRLMELNV